MIWFYIVPLVLLILLGIISEIKDWREGHDVKLGDVLWLLFIAAIPVINIVFAFYAATVVLAWFERITLVKGRKQPK